MPKHPKWLGLSVIAFVFVMAAAVVHAQPKRIFKIGYLTNDSISVDTPRQNVFRQTLHDLGSEGKNIIIEHHITEGRPAAT